jgi:hypothetical protein
MADKPHWRKATTLSLRPNNRKALDALAEQNNTTISALVNRWIEQAAQEAGQKDAA